MEPAAAHDAFFHVRVIIGIVTGLCVTRLLTGMARFVQHPSRQAIYPVHLGWACFVLLAVIHFWWFEFGLSHVTQWTFPLYLFVIVYASLFFFLSTLLFPDRMEEYDGFAGYFHARQAWFYGLLAAIFLFDIADTALKGAAHLHAFGRGYPVVLGELAAVALAAIRIRDRRFHAGFVVAVLALEAWWILRQFDVLA